MGYITAYEAADVFSLIRTKGFGVAKSSSVLKVVKERYIMANVLDIQI